MTAEIRDIPHKMSELRDSDLRLRVQESAIRHAEQQFGVKAKLLVAKKRKQQMEIDFRENTQLKLTKWEDFRSQKQVYVDKIIRIMKDKIRVRTLVGLINMRQTFPNVK